MTKHQSTVLHTLAKLHEAVFVALGTASVCWDEEGIFRSDLATEVGNQLVTTIWDILEPEKPHLGLATTLEMLTELECRARVASVIGKRWPNQTSFDD